MTREPSSTSKARARRDRDDTGLFAAGIEWPGDRRRLGLGRSAGGASDLVEFLMSKVVVSSHSMVPAGWDVIDGGKDEPLTGRMLQVGGMRYRIVPLTGGLIIELQDDLAAVFGAQAQQLIALWRTPQIDAWCRLVQRLARDYHPDLTAEEIKAHWMGLSIPQIQAVNTALLTP
jgi:hypothetical protein